MEINNKGFNEKEITATYMIAMLTKYETMQIMKNHFGEKFNDVAERLFHQQYDYMEQFVESPSRFSYLFVMETGKELEKELGMTEEDAQQLALLGNQMFFDLNEERRETIEELTKQLMDVA